MAFKNGFISVVLPLYMPKGNWALQFIKNIRELDSFLGAGVPLQYIVVYDDAADEEMASTFRQVSAQLGHVRFISYGENRGKGYALREGVKAANTPCVITMDFDFPYIKENIAELISLLQHNQCDIVVGSRSAAYFRQVPFRRRLISKLFSRLNKVLLGLPLHDTQSGMKGFNQKGQQVFLQTTVSRFLVDTEFVLRGSRQALRIRAMDIELRPGISFSSFGFTVLATELGNFARLLWLSKGLKTQPAVFESYTMQKLPAH